MNSTQQVKVKRGATRKRQRERRRWDSFTDWARVQASVITMPIARAVGRLGIHPNTLTIVGLLLQVGVAVVFGLGYVKLGGWLLLIVRWMGRWRARSESRVALGPFSIQPWIELPMLY